MFIVQNKHINIFEYTYLNKNKMNFSLTVIFILILYTVFYTVSIWYSSKQSYETTTRSILILLAAGSGLFYIIFSFMTNDENNKYDDLYTEYQKNEAKIRTYEILYDDKLEDIKRWKGMMGMMRFSNNRGAGNVYPVMDLWKLIKDPADPSKGFTQADIENNKEKLVEFINDYTYIDADDYMYTNYVTKMNSKGIFSEDMNTPEETDPITGSVTSPATAIKAYNRDTLKKLFEEIQKENNVQEKRRLKIIYNSIVDSIRDEFYKGFSQHTEKTKNKHFEDLYYKFNTGKKYLVLCKQEIRNIKKRQKEILQGYYNSPVEKETPFSITAASATSP